MADEAKSWFARAILPWFELIGKFFKWLVNRSFPL